VLSYHIEASVLGFDPRVEWDEKTPNPRLSRGRDV
jgi:hypothetical protein